MQKKNNIFADRMYREAETIKVMVGIYCRHHHGRTVSDCPACSAVQSYALDRLHYCPYQSGKTSCKNCPIHCYKATMKDSIREIMRFAGPRMVLRHPILTIYHFIDDRRKEPVLDLKVSCQSDRAA